jgi:hypothetical protein
MVGDVHPTKKSMRSVVGWAPPTSFRFFTCLLIFGIWRVFGSVPMFFSE